MNYGQVLPQKFAILVKTCHLFLWLSILPFCFKAKPILAAEKITTFIGPLQISLAVDSLETFANEGKIEPDLGLIVNRLDQAAQVELRKMLQQRFEINPDFISRYSRLPLVEGILNQVGEVVQPKPGINGLSAMRGATILAAADKKNGLTIINVLRRFPSQNIYLDSDLLLKLSQDFGRLAEYRQVAVAEVIRQSELEAEASPINSDRAKAHLAEQERLQDLSQPGTFSVSKQAMSFKIDQPHTTDIGLSSPYNLNFDLYLPQGKSKPAPLIVILQGFGATRDTYSYIAQQLASYGYAVASIEHRGVNLAQRLEFPNTELSGWITPSEFISRPLDVTHFLDKLEDLVAEESGWAARLNLEQIGVFGYSFGGYSALAIAGAEINFPRLLEECNQEELNTVLSFSFQCQAKYLAPHSGKIQDPRIKAVFSAYPLTNPIFGLEGMSQIDIPTAIVAGSQDNVVPPVQNQIHPFLWLNTADKYLALLSPGDHFTTVKPKDRGVEGIPKITKFPATDPKSEVAINYLKSLSVAFFNLHLQGLEQYRPYLTADYNKSISQEDISIHLIQSLQPEQLATAYGKNPPIPLTPKPIVATPKPSTKETILAEINRTGVLKVAVRSDAAPFGSLNDNYNWTGYCASLVNSLEDYLELKLDRPGGIQVVKLPSNLENRYQLVQQNRVHLECGPNSIKSEIPGVTVSSPFWASSSQFLATSDRTNQVNRNSDTHQPLTDDYYGMLLPSGDRTWQKTINNFLKRRRRRI